MSNIIKFPQPDNDNANDDEYQTTKNPSKLGRIFFYLRVILAVMGDQALILVFSLLFAFRGLIIFGGVVFFIAHLLNGGSWKDNTSMMFLGLWVLCNIGSDWLVDAQPFHKILRVKVDGNS